MDSLPLSSAEPEALGSTVLGHRRVDFKLPGAGREEHRCPDTREGNLVYGPSALVVRKMSMSCRAPRGTSELSVLAAEQGWSREARYL